MWGIIVTVVFLEIGGRSCMWLMIAWYVNNEVKDISSW